MAVKPLPDPSDLNGPWSVIELPAWPFRIQVVDCKGDLLFQLDRPSLSSAQNTLADFHAGVGLEDTDDPQFGKQAILAAAHKQIASITWMVACANWAGTLFMVGDMIKKTKGESC